VRPFGPFLPANDFVRQKMRNTLEEVEINYRRGPITEEHGGSDGPRAGDSVLDAPVVRLPGKQTVALRELLPGTRWTLLLFSGRGGNVPELAETGRKIAARFPAALEVYTVAGGFPIDSSIGGAVLLDPMDRFHDTYGVQEACLY